MSKRRVKLWLAMGGFLGVAAMPCPECGTPMILHVWPLVGLVLIARGLKNRHRGKGAVEMETHAADTAASLWAGHDDSP